jgi:hypothetical protein
MLDADLLSVHYNTDRACRTGVLARRLRWCVGLGSKNRIDFVSWIV